MGGMRMRETGCMRFRLRGFRSDIVAFDLARAGTCALLRSCEVSCAASGPESDAAGCIWQEGGWCNVMVSLVRRRRAEFSEAGPRRELGRKAHVYTDTQTQRHAAGINLIEVLIDTRLHRSLLWRLPVCRHELTVILLQAICSLHGKLCRRRVNAAGWCKDENPGAPHLFSSAMLVVGFRLDRTQIEALCLL